jgi:hypothetical protein
VSLSPWRNFVGVCMTMILPLSAFPDNPTGAILHSSGQGVLVNGNQVPASTAVFDNDFIQTQKQSPARIETTGSSATLDSETVLQFQLEELALDHGSLSVYTSTGMRVRVGCVTITPVNPSHETLYEVVDRDGKVTVHASRSDVYIDAKSKETKEVRSPSRSKRDLVREGEQKSREEKCGGAYTKGATPEALGALMNSPWAVGVGAATAVGLTCWALCRSDDPISPSKPSKP